MPTVTKSWYFSVSKYTNVSRTFDAAFTSITQWQSIKPAYILFESLLEKVSLGLVKVYKRRYTVRICSGQIKFFVKTDLSSV